LSQTDLWKTDPGHLPNMDEFPEIGLAHDRKFEISKKMDKSLLEKVKFQRVIWMSFPRFANKG